MERKTKRNVLSGEEETVNTIVFAAWVFLTVGAFIVVVGFMGGSFKDWIALAVTAIGIIIRFLEKRYLGLKGMRNTHI